MKRNPKLSCLALFLAAAMALSATACTGPTEKTGVGAAGNTAAAREPNSVGSTVVAEDRGMYQMGEPVRYTYMGVEMEYTVENMEIFDRYTQANLPEDAFGPMAPNNEKFILLDVRIRKVSGPPLQQEGNFDEYSNINDLMLCNQDILDVIDSEDPSNFLRPEIRYFDGGSEVDEHGKGYEYYWLDPGEEKVFQVGWCLQGPLEGRGPAPAGYLNDTNGLALCIGVDSNVDKGRFIHLEAKSLI